MIEKMNADLDRIKQEIDIAWLIGQTFTVLGSGHTLTTEEHDSLKIFTRNNSWAWYSQTGRDGKALGGTAIDWYMHIHGCAAGEAIRALGHLLDGGTLPAAAKAFPGKQKAEAWKSQQWQAEARRKLEAAQVTLLNEESAGGADLQERGIRRDMWLAWGLGFAPAWNYMAGRMMPAIWIPWMNRQITAIQYRFLGVAKGDETADRYGQRKGGKRYLCGLHLCPDAGRGALETLFVVEGELNAVSIFQAVYGIYAADVVSFGPQANINNPEVVRMAGAVSQRYRRVIVWADEPDVVLKAMEKMPGHAMGFRSPNGKDANDLLRLGLLDDLVFELIRRAKTRG